MALVALSKAILTEAFTKLENAPSKMHLKTDK
jgi:hypothetical protein